MIAPSHHLPFVQWHGQRSLLLSEEWLTDSLYQSAELTGMYDWNTCDQVVRAIVHFLQKDFHSNSISIDDLQKIMRKSLTGVGLTEMAEQALLIAPRINIYLPDIARQAPYELLFFRTLKERLEEMIELMVRGVRLEGLRPCVKILENAQRWQQQCQKLSEEIVHFSRQNLKAEEDLGIELVIC